MCFDLDDDERDNLGRSDPDRVDEVDGLGVEGGDDWIPLAEVVSGILRGWRGDD